MRNPSEKSKAPGGKSNATCESKWTRPVAITAPAVRSVPIQRLTVIVAMEVIRR
jgi:hypothetical protein